LISVIDHFVRLLDFTPSELQRCATDTDGHLVPRLRSITSSVAIFIAGSMSISLHYGEVQTSPGNGDALAVLAGGRRDSLRGARRAACGARPDLGDRGVPRQLSLRPSLWRATPLLAPDGGDRFNVKKEDGVEPDLWVRLYRIEF
jgi:hypothetical protein